MDINGRKKSKSISSCGRDSRIAHNGARSISDSRGRDSNNDGVNPILRAETFASMNAFNIARSNLSNAMMIGAGAADGSGGTKAAAVTSIPNASDDILSDGSSVCDCDNDIDAIDDSVIDLVDGGDDSDDDIRDESCEILTIGPGKGKPPFHLLSGDVMRVMTDKVRGNYSNGNPNVSSADELKYMLGTVVEKRVFLLKLAEELDRKMEVVDVPTGTTICSLLAAKIPISVFVKMAKAKVATALVDIWAILVGVLKTNMLR